MARFNPEDYTTVAERIDRFWAKYPSGRIATEMVHFEPGQCIIKAEVFADKDDVMPMTSDYAEERLDGSPVNRTSMVENCATSAIGRALADLGGEFTGSKRPSREEMQKVERMKSDPVKVPDHFWPALAAVQDLASLRELWDKALQAGYSGVVGKDFSKRKEELSALEEAAE